VSKGEATRDAIIRVALKQAMDVGLEGISLGVLATRLELSKSGLFAHFKSKEALQLAILEEAIETFTAKVILPALQKPRGEPRVRALFEGKLAWIESNGAGNGCFFSALEKEYDDRPGPIRDRLVRMQMDWRGVIIKAVALAIHEHHFDAQVDSEQFAFDVHGIDLSVQHSLKLLGDKKAKERARQAFERLVEGARAKRRR
jgi:AcrR family transcriptional regulator